MPVNSRFDLIDYCLRRLGSPVIEINVDDEQVEDRIDDALAMFREWHYDASDLTFFTHEITQEDKDNEYLLMPDNILGINRIFPFSLAQSGLNLEYRTLMTEVLNAKKLATQGISGYVITEAYMSIINRFFNREKRIRFNKAHGRVYIDTDWDEIEVGQFLAFEGFILVDPEEFPKVYNDTWLKAYATALIKRQWGQNMLKYEGIQLPGGITLNGRQLFDDASNEIERLEEDLRNSFQLPIDIYMG